MTKQEILTARHVASGVSTPKAIAEVCGVPMRTARKMLADSARAGLLRVERHEGGGVSAEYVITAKAKRVLGGARWSPLDLSPEAQADLLFAAEFEAEGGMIHAAHVDEYGVGMSLSAQRMSYLASLGLVVHGPDAPARYRLTRAGRRVVAALVEACR